MPETFSTIPKGMQEGGMVIRQIPREVIEGRVKYVPLFSLYATPKGGGRPMMVEMIKASGLSPEAFVREKIIRPFAQQWVDLAVLKGISPQPHAQNLMLEVGANGQPTGKFVHRDFGGFNIEFDYRSKKGMAAVSSLPKIVSVDKDYKNDRFGDPKRTVGKLDSFCSGGRSAPWRITSRCRPLPSTANGGLKPMRNSASAGSSIASALAPSSEATIKRFSKASPS